MYRKCITAAIAAAVLLVAATVPARCSATDWSYTFSCTSKLIAGTRTGALDSLDALDHFLPWTWIDPPAILVWTEIGADKLDANYRAPLAQGQTKTWTIYAQPRVQIMFPAPYAFSWSPGSTTPALSGPPSLWTASLTLSVPYGSPYSGPTAWNLTGGQSGSASLPMLWMGSGKPVYTFTFNVTAVPEPSSVLALLGGIGSLALLRRRR